jgi:hypothetical protein
LESIQLNAYIPQRPKEGVRDYNCISLTEGLIVSSGAFIKIRIAFLYPDTTITCRIIV